MSANKGWAIHCHHDTLIEWCYDYRERVHAIQKKPEHEVAARLRLFKLLPAEAVLELPIALLAYNQAREAWDQAWEAYNQAWETLNQAGEAWDQAGEAYNQSGESWGQTEQTRWHDKWCGCQDWDGTEIRFSKVNLKRGKP